MQNYNLKLQRVNKSVYLNYIGFLLLSKILSPCRSFVRSLSKIKLLLFFKSLFVSNVMNL